MCIECKFINAFSVARARNASTALRIHQCRLLTIRVARRRLLLPNQPPELKSFSRHGHASDRFQEHGGWQEYRVSRHSRAQFSRFPENKRPKSNLPIPPLLSAAIFIDAWNRRGRRRDAVYSTFALRADACNEKQQRRDIIPRKITATRSYRNAERSPRVTV